MEKGVIVLDADSQFSGQLCALLTDRHYTPRCIDSVEDFERYLGTNECQVVIINLESVSFDGGKFKALKKRKNNMHIITISGRRLHPELADAFRHHIYAGLVQPVDMDELDYLLRSIFE